MKFQYQLYVIVLFLLSSISPFNISCSIFAQEQIWNRTTILNNRDNPKEKLSEAGIDLSINHTEFFQGLTEGKGDKTWELGGKSDIFTSFQANKFGLTDGLTLSLHAEFLNGDDTLTKGDGSVLPINTALGFPGLAGHHQDLSILVSQQFNKETNFIVGKFNMLDSAAKVPLIGGGGLTTFWNTALAAPISGVTPPYLLGCIVSHDFEPANFTFMIYDPRNAQNSDVIKDPFDEGVTNSLSVTVPVEISGLQGFHGIRGVYSTAKGIDFKDLQGFILPSQGGKVGQVDGFWFASYSFQQYLFQDIENKKKGWGLFGQIAFSDGNPNPFGWSSFIGIGGDSLLSSRPNDKFGIAYFYYGFSEDLKDSLSKINRSLKDEKGLELFYNIETLNWLYISPDLQILDTALGDKISYFFGIRSHIKVF